jgi:metal-dependent hydrolase (beta-lactamase superfamily II)
MIGATQTWKVVIAACCRHDGALSEPLEVAVLHQEHRGSAVVGGLHPSGVFAERLLRAVVAEDDTPHLHLVSLDVPCASS